LQEEEAAKMINEDELKLRALAAVEQNGIVFIDELDKVAKRGEYGGPDVSREGVQRDLLPLVEGCTVSTKYGMVRTDHILFIASGAFHLAKPSDLIPELQGRLPIRVELSALEHRGFRADSDRTGCFPDRAVHGAAEHRGCQAGICGGWGAAHGRSRLPGQRTHRKYRRPSAAHRHGTAAGNDFLRGARPIRSGGDR
jgi:hypothetical protein